MSPSEAGRRPALIAGLEAESLAWQALLNMLSEEEQVLMDGDADRLASLSASKLAQLETLSDLARARGKELVAAGHTADRAGMEAWLTQRGQPDQRVRWQQLCEMELQAQAANQRVGKLIELRLGTTRQALNVLVHAATHQGGLYDQAGQAVAGNKGKPLTAA